MKKEYKQQAFPNSIALPTEFNYQEGMTLLDYFAGQAMNGLLCSSNFGANISMNTFSIKGYEIAAAMMEERKKYLTP